MTPLVGSTNMLVCGEDLGMIPESVPDVMNKLQILSLEIERMPKTPQWEFSDLFSLPYNSVCTTSTHDMSPLRNWWKEDREKIQRYYNNVLHYEGQAPGECSSDIASRIITNHLATNSMLTIIPLPGLVRYRRYGEEERYRSRTNQCPSQLKPLLVLPDAYTVGKSVDERGV